MADFCSIKNSRKFQVIKSKSPKTSSLDIYAAMQTIQNKYHREAEIDEIDNIDTEQHLRDTLKVKKIGNISYTKDLTKKLNVNSLDEALQVLNKEYPDLFIKLGQVGNLTTIKIKHRPRELDIYPAVNYEVKFTRDLNSIYLTDALQKLQDYAGIKIIPIDNSNQHLIDINAQQAGAFIYNGDIYLNTDNASIQDPIHEMLHLFIGSIRYSDTLTYNRLLNLMAEVGDINNRAQYYPNRTQNDILEELFVEEVAKYVTGQNSVLNAMPVELVSKLIYHIKRDIDLIIDGKLSSKCMSTQDVFESSIIELSKDLKSDILSKPTLVDSFVHRVLSNEKEELMAKNELIEDCGL